MVQRFSILFFLFLFFFISKCSYAQLPANMDTVFQNAEDLKYADPNRSLILFEQCQTQYLEHGDTLKVIQCYIGSSSIYTNRANYSKAYDGLWKALILSKESGNNLCSGQIYDGIGLLYSLFHRNKDAVNYYNQAIAIKKELIRQEKVEPEELAHTYFLLTIFYREQNQLDLAQSYLDSCRLAGKTSSSAEESGDYVNCEQAYLYYYAGKYADAKRLLLEAEKNFLKNNETYLVILDSFLGDVFRASNQLDQSKSYYLKSLKVALKYSTHQNYLPEIYEKLATLCQQMKVYDQAFRYLQQSKDLNDSIFGSRSLNNRSLLEIKDQFLKEQEKQKELMKEAHFNELEQDRHILFLKNTLLLISLGAIMALSVIAFLVLRFRYRSEKRFLKAQELAKEQKNKEIMEVKNKELTTSSLQIIQKNELLQEIRNKLTGIDKHAKSAEITNVLNMINLEGKQDWDEFNARFTAVNESFYRNLSSKFPDLTPREKELCALIKLNFSSKEMSQLLGISIESVHTSRYRLRQKLDLAKGENLAEFIAKI